MITRWMVFVLVVGVAVAAPARLPITWHDDDTLKIETEAGTQSRLLRFLGNAAVLLAADGSPIPNAPPEAPSWQGLSIAQWEYAGGARGRRGAGAAADANANN